MQRKNIYHMSLVLMGVFVFSANAYAEGEDLESRVKAIEEKLESSPPKKTIFEDVKVGGYIQAYYGWFEDDNVDDTFEIRRAFVALSGKIQSDVAFKVQVDAAASSNILRDGWIKYSGLPWAVITLGQFKIPFSHEQITGASKLDTIERSRVATALSYGRDLGLMLEGDVVDEALLYAVAIVNGTGRNTADSNDSKDVVGRVVVAPFKFKRGDNAFGDLRAGVSFQTGRQAPSGTDEGSRNRCGALLMYAYENFEMKSEYIFQDMEQTDGSSRYSDGWYITGMYRVNDLLQGLARFERYDPNREVEGDMEDVLTLGANIFPAKVFLIQANYRRKTEAPGVANDEFLLQAQVKF